MGKNSGSRGYSKILRKLKFFPRKTHINFVVFCPGYLQVVLLNEKEQKLEILYPGFAVSPLAPLDIQHEQNISIRPRSVVPELCGADRNVIGEMARAVLEKSRKACRKDFQWRGSRPDV